MLLQFAIDVKGIVRLSSLKRILQLGVLGLAGALLLAYLADWAVLASAGSRKVYEDIQVDQVFTDTNKWNQIEYSRGTSVTERCVDALFPHNGSRPCWYVKKHTMTVTNTD
jgi:hypothetical protein